MRIHRASLMLLLLLPGAAGAAQATLPTTAPAVLRPLPAEQIRQWFTRLGDTSPEAREAARFELLGLKAEELPMLRAVVAASRPIRPAQATELHDIVVHILLAGTPRAETPQAFLGLFWPDAQRGRLEDADTPALRLIGCPAFRFLQDGDVIKAIAEKNTPADMGREELMAAIPSFKPGDVLHLTVLRHGQIKQIAVQLDARPIDLDASDPTGPARQAPAEKIWTDEFLPLLAEEMTAIPAD